MSTATPGTSKDDLRRRVEQGYRSMRAVIDTLPRERFDEAMPAGWTLKAIVAHLAAWEETVPPRVARALAGAGDTGPYDDIDAFNATVVREARGATLDEVLARWDAAHARLVDVVRSLDEEPIEKLVTDIVEWNTTGHYPDHHADLGAAIRTSNELVAIVQQAWIPFRLAVASLGRRAIERATPVGRTYKEFVAHVAAWEERTAARLGTFRETGEFTSVADTDAFNADVVERT
ncbi:MAG: maleylpyruvate isomerase N-terminal domain-containing protein, partial [Chloroflexota bacterium]